MDIHRLYGIGPRPAPLPPGALQPNPESHDNAPDSSNTNQAINTDQNIPEDEPQTSDAEQEALTQAEDHQVNIPTSQSPDPTSQPRDHKGSHTNQPAKSAENRKILKSLIKNLDNILKNNRIEGLPSLEDCPELHFETHQNTSLGSGPGYIDQRLHLGTIEHDGQPAPVYMYLTNGDPKPVVEMETLNPHSHSITRAVLPDRIVWNDVDLVDPIKTSRANIRHGSKNWLPYEMLAKYYFLRHYEQLGEGDFVNRGKWFFESDFKRYLKTANNNLHKGATGDVYAPPRMKKPVKSGSGSASSTQKKKPPPPSTTTTTRKAKGKQAVREDPVREDDMHSSSDEPDRTEDTDYVPAGTIPPLPRRTSRRKRVGGRHHGEALDAQPEDTIQPTGDIYIQAGDPGAFHDGYPPSQQGHGSSLVPSRDAPAPLSDEAPREPTLQDFLPYPENLSTQQLRLLSSLAAQEARRRESIAGLELQASDAATQMSAMQHTFVSTAVHGGYEDERLGFEEEEEEGLGFPHGYEGLM